MIQIEVPLGERSYPVLVGPAALGELSSLVPDDVRRVAFVTQENIGFSTEIHLPTSTHYLPNGEEAKQLAVIESLCSAFAQGGLTRSDLIVGIGGGVVTDVAGFAAAVYHRGSRVLHVPTTLLGQIDAAIGGKTGVNSEYGKNLIGTFSQPKLVISDTSFLKSLKKKEMVCGYAEILKQAIIKDKKFFNWLKLNTRYIFLQDIS